MASSRARFAPAHAVDLIDAAVSQAVTAGVIHKSADDVPYDGTHIEMGGAQLLNFGVCSYLGLEVREELRKGVIDAVTKFGTQFAFSRTYLECPLYGRLESTLERITGGKVLVTPTTTLGHIAALPVLVRPGDAVIIDQFAHASLQTAVALLRENHVETVRHNRTDLLEAKIQRLVQTHERVWCIVDGIYSMHGDFAPLPAMSVLLDRYPQMQLYVDDAHSTSWLGKHGHGFALEVLGVRERVVVALSLCKGFSAGGAALVFPTAELRNRVRRCGGPMIFSGPIQPPMLGAAVASAELHLTPEFAGMQAKLAQRIQLVLEQADSLKLPVVGRDLTPIFFMLVGDTKITFDMVHLLRGRGICVCPSTFPAVAANRGGIRFTVSLSNSEDDICYLMSELVSASRRLGLQKAERPSKAPPSVQATHA